MRIFTAALVLSVLIGAGCAQSWPTFRGDYQRRGTAASQQAYEMADLGLLWNYTTSGPVESSPAVADIDGDGRMDVVFGSDDRRIYALNHRGELMWSYLTRGPVRSAPTLADIFGDGRTEVLMGSDDGNIYLLDGGGILIWNHSTGGPVRSSPVVWDLDDVPGKEIVFGSYDGRIISLSAKGELAWDYETAESVGSSPALFDMDADGSEEVIIGSNDNMVYVLKYPPYKIWSFSTDGDVLSTPMIDPYGKIVVGSGDGRIYRLGVNSLGAVQTRRVRTATGYGTAVVTLSGLQPIWNYSTNGPLYSSASAGNILANGGYGIVTGSHDRSLYYLSGNGTLNGTYTLNRGIDSSPALTDLDGDGIADIIVGSDDGGIYVIDADMGNRFGYQTGGEVKSSPAVADMRGDGSLEFAVGSKDGSLYVFGSLRMRNISLGDELYDKAAGKKAVGDIGGAERAIEEAKGTYAGVGYAEGMRRCENLVKTIRADELLRNATAAYGRGNLTYADEQAAQASRLYKEANDTEGRDRSENLIRRVEANTYFLEAEYIINQGFADNATEYLEAARMYYLSINDSVGLEKTRNLSETAATMENTPKEKGETVGAATVKSGKETTSSENPPRDGRASGDTHCWPLAAISAAGLLAAGWALLRPRKD